MNSNNRPLVLVDGSSYLYRAFHAMPNLTNSQGGHTGAVYGVINMLRRLIKDYDPRYMAVVFDAKGKTFRDEMYPDYKATRPPMPDTLRSQIEPIHDIVRALGLPLLVVEGVEADDVIGTLARQAAARGFDTVVSTGDKDLAQLVDEHVTLINTMTDTVSDPAGVTEKFGVPPERIVDYLTLIGDTSDNIPGVPKVGPKTAVKWLQEYGSLEGVVEHAGEIKGKVGENLRSTLSHLDLSRTLVTIRTDVELPVGPTDLERRAPDEQTLRELYARMEFKTWLAELGGLESSESESVDASYEMVTEAKALDGWIARLREAGTFAFDTETTDLDAINAEVVGVSFALRSGEAAYVPLAHSYPGAPAQLERDAVLAQLAPLLENDALEKIGHNLKYDMNVLVNHGVALRGIAYDTMLESYVLDSTASRHDMDSLALKYLGYKTIKYDEVAGKGKSQIRFDEVNVEQATDYAAEDADITLRLHETLWPRLEAIPSLKKLFEEIEVPLVPVLARIERNGVKIDAAMLNRQSQELAKRMMEIEKEAFTHAGGPFNIASPKQIQEILFDRLKLPVLQKTPKGQPSTAESVLAELALDYPLPQIILDHRALSKLRSTYTDKLPEMINPRTGRVHTSYHQAVAATGRLSSSEPNLQNIPIRTQEGRRIREAFIPEPGNLIVSADYSQIELRIMAHLSGDETLLAAFAENRDVHRATAAEVFGAAPDAVSDEQRRTAKAINFGLIYGMSAFGLARQLRIDRASAQEYVELYFKRHPGVKRFMDETRVLAHEQGYVETVFGRRLYLPEINAANQTRRQYAERTAINAPMQGTAADLIKMAMLAVDAWIQAEANDVRMIMQVHDELVLEAPEDQIEEAKSRLVECMTGVAKLKVPLVAEVAHGRNWNEAHP